MSPALLHYSPFNLTLEEQIWISVEELRAFPVSPYLTDLGSRASLKKRAFLSPLFCLYFLFQQESRENMKSRSKFENRLEGEFFLS